MLFSVPLSSRALNFLADVIRRREAIVAGSSRCNQV